MTFGSNVEKVPASRSKKKGTSSNILNLFADVTFGILTYDACYDRID